MNPSAVIPAKAGIHFDFDLDLDLALLLACENQETAKSKWIPAFAGMTDANGFAPYD
jgi:hypothetical protein